MSTIQHAEAHKLLAIISSAVTTHRLLTYRSAAKALGRNPANNSRMVAQVCDLLDAAAALAGTPLLALVMVRELSGEINRKAWKKAWTEEETKPGRRELIIKRSLGHRFTGEDFKAISEALHRLDGKSNRAAWNFVRETIPRDQMYRNLEGQNCRPSRMQLMTSTETGRPVSKAPRSGTPVILEYGKPLCDGRGESASSAAWRALSVMTVTGTWNCITLSPWPPKASTR